ncbi:unnamed protein product, partial [Notodromas monacha]
PGATRFHEIQKLWGDRTGSAPAAKKSGDVMSMSVDSLPMKEASSIGILRKGFQETESHHMNGAQENALGEIQEASVGELKSEIRTLKGALKEKDFKIHSLEREVTELKKRLDQVQVQFAQQRNKSSSDNDHDSIMETA